MEPHGPVSPLRFGRLPPSGEPIGLSGLARVLWEQEPAKALACGLRALLGTAVITFHASGREALRVALGRVAAESGRDEVVVPAYTCFSVPAAAVAAGLRVRLVDVDPDGRIDVSALARLPLERAAAIVVCNLFGVPEPVDTVRKLAEDAGAAVVDDAAQSLGAAGPEGPAGARGSVGILSFARGKPLSALGGGAIVSRGEPPLLDSSIGPARANAVARALAYNAALAGPVFRLLSGVPALGIGKTVYDPEFVRGAIGGASLALAAALLPDLAAAAARRAARARELAAWFRSRTEFTPILPPEGTTGAFPRLAVRAPTAAARTRALARLEELGVGASAMYPSALDAVAALAPHLAGGPPHVPGARDLAARVVTVPTHGRLRVDLLEAAHGELRLAPNRGSD